MINLQFNQVIVCTNSSLLFIAGNISLYKYIIICSLFILPLVGRHLGCFHFLGIRNKVNQTICEQAYMWTFALFLLDKYLEMEWLGCMVGVCLTF